MARSRKLRARCIGCDRLREHCGPFSNRGLCGECGVARMTANLQRGYDPNETWVKHWREGMAAAARLPIREPTR